MQDNYSFSHVVGADGVVVGDINKLKDFNGVSIIKVSGARESEAEGCCGGLVEVNCWWRGVWRGVWEGIIGPRGLNKFFCIFSSMSHL